MQINIVFHLKISVIIVIPAVILVMEQLQIIVFLVQHPNFFKLILLVSVPVIVTNMAIQELEFAKLAI